MSWRPRGWDPSWRSPGSIALRVLIILPLYPLYWAAGKVVAGIDWLHANLP